MMTSWWHFLGLLWHTFYWLIFQLEKISQTCYFFWIFFLFNIDYKYFLKCNFYYTDISTPISSAYCSIFISFSASSAKIVHLITFTQYFFLTLSHFEFCCFRLDWTSFHRNVSEISRMSRYLDLVACLQPSKYWQTFSVSI